MHESLKPFLDRCDLGLLRQVESPCGKLVLFNYTDKCTFERAWDDYTIQSRGIIFEKETGRQVAYPFKKFFNIGENGCALADPSEPYHLLEKMDGSLGIIYHYNDKWDIATRGSFTSDQANYAREHLLPKYDFSKLLTRVTLLTEIIYPENRIVVPYGDRNELVLLGANCSLQERRETIYSVPNLKLFSGLTRIPLVPFHELTIEDALKKCETIPRTEEGWVLWYPRLDYRIKIKGVEYLKIAKIMMHMSPLSLWEVMKAGKVPEEYLAQLPEEFRLDVDKIVASLEGGFARVFEEISKSLQALPSLTDFREVGIFLKENKGIVPYPNAVFPMLRKQADVVEKIIMGEIRPDANVLEKAS